MDRNLKVIVLGDDCGIKTHVLRTLINHHENTQGRRFTIVENKVLPVRVDGLNVSLTLVDTAGLESFYNMRTLVYHDVDCVILCFDLTSLVEFDNAILKWLPEARQLCPSRCGFVLCGVNPESPAEVPRISEETIKQRVAENPAINFYRYFYSDLHVVHMFNDVVRLAIGGSLKLRGFYPGHWITVTYRKKKYDAIVKIVDEAGGRLKIFYLGKKFWWNYEWVNENQLSRVVHKENREVLDKLNTEFELGLYPEIISLICGFLESPAWGFSIERPPR